MKTSALILIAAIFFAATSLAKATASPAAAWGAPYAFRSPVQRQADQGTAQTVFAGEEYGARTTGSLTIYNGPVTVNTTNNGPMTSSNSTNIGNSNSVTTSATGGGDNSMVTVTVVPTATVGNSGSTTQSGTSTSTSTPPGS